MSKNSIKSSKKKGKGKATSKAAKKSKKNMSKKDIKSSKKPSVTSSKKQKEMSKGPKNTIKTLIAQIEASDLLVTKGSKYDKDMNDIAFTHCSSGKSLKRLARLLGVSYRTIKYWRERNCTFFTSINRGYSSWLLELPDKLVDHLATGDSYEAFAAEIDRSVGFLYALERAWDEFREAKERGLPKSLRTWEQLNKRQAAGQLTLDMGEIPLMGNGLVIKDDDGKVIMTRKIVPARYSDRSLIFAMQNRFSQYKPSVDNSNDDILDDLKEAIAEVNGEVTNGQEMGSDSEDIE